MARTKQTARKSVGGKAPRMYDDDDDYFCDYQEDRVAYAHTTTAPRKTRIKRTARKSVGGKVPGMYDDDELAAKAAHFRPPF